MATIWKLGEATVDDVRELQPARRRSAYNTVQTVMSRLVESGLLERERRGHAYVYRARLDEADYLTQSIDGKLRRVSPTTRQAVLVNLVDQLDTDSLDELAERVRQVRRARTKRGS